MKKNSTVLLGLQFGDEGKGKIVDYLATKYDAVVRFNGGNNAGHTVVVNSIRLPLSHLPSSALHQKKLYIAQGSSINPKVLINEIKILKSLGKDVNLSIDYRCHIIMPYHQLLDNLSEITKKNKIGSLNLGVGYSYEDKTNREGIRLEHILNEDLLREKMKLIWDLKRNRIEKIYNHKYDLSFEQVFNEYKQYGQFLKEYTSKVSEEIIENWSKNSYLFESAQAFYLDYSFGTYPFTVAYNTIASSVFTGSGLPPLPIDVLGVVKAYSIRVGNGPFPTEQDNNDGDKLRLIGNEYGTVSKRPRRCGWIDLPLLKYAIKMNGVKSIALTKLDVLSHFNEIPICVNYKSVTERSLNISDLSQVTPEYQLLPGWNCDISSIRSFSRLPSKCKSYIRFIQTHLKVSIKYISVGQDRSQTIEV